MAEILELIKKRLPSVIDVIINSNKLILTLNIKEEIQKSRILAEPYEVKDMLRILGGLREDLSMEIEIDNQLRNIKLKFQNSEDFEEVKNVLDNIWERTIHLLEELEKGNANVLRGVGDFSD
jgi:hypothetical protein